MERTRIITATITIIETNPKDTGKPDNKVIAEALKKQLKADDVLVSGVKDFILTPEDKPAKKTTKKPAAKKTTTKKETSTAPAKKTTTKKAAPKKEVEKKPATTTKKKTTTKKEAK